MSKTIPLTSLSLCFAPIDESKYIFQCKKNATIPFRNRKNPKKPIMANSQDLYFIVNPINPRKFEDINHGSHFDMLVFEKVPICDIVDENNIEDFIRGIRKSDILFNTFISAICVTDNDPRIEYTVPEESPLQNFVGLSEEICRLAKLPLELSEDIPIVQMKEDVFFFNHIIGLYIFAQIGDDSIAVRHYTSDNNERIDHLTTYIRFTKDNQIIAYFELDDLESISFNRRLICTNPDFWKEAQNAFKFDHVEYITSIQKSEIGNNVKKINQRAKKYVSSDDEVGEFFYTGNNAFLEDMLTSQYTDTYGNPMLF